MIKETFPNVHVVVGGNVITRLQEELPKQERFFTEVFDSAILYEGEHALLVADRGLERRSATWPPCRISCIAMRSGVHQNKEIYTEKTTALPLPDFDGFPLDRYFVPERIIPYLATRGCYWGRCTFCDHGQGYFDQYRGMTGAASGGTGEGAARQVPVPPFPVLRRILSAGAVQEGLAASGGSGRRHQMDDADPVRGDLARPGHLGSGGEGRLLHALLWDGVGERAGAESHGQARQEERDPEQSASAAKAGIWNHVMAFYGFPGETRDEALETRQFVIDNQPVIHSVELFYFVAYRHTPMVRNPEKFGITIHKQEEYDLPLDYYYTLNEPVGISCLDAMQLCEEFYQNDFQPWAVRVNAREHVFLYISKFGTNKLPQIYAQRQTVGSSDSVSGLVTWPVAMNEGEDGKEGMSRVVSHGVG